MRNAWRKDLVATGTIHLGGDLLSRELEPRLAGRTDQFRDHKISRPVDLGRWDWARSRHTDDAGTGHWFQPTWGDWQVICQRGPGKWVRIVIVFRNAFRGNQSLGDSLAVLAVTVALREGVCGWPTPVRRCVAVVCRGR